jgi:hypothetical protein
MLMAFGCADTGIVPFAGYWQGKFEGIPAEPEFNMRPEWAYKGFLQIYGTRHRYKMHMESNAQIVDIAGTWTHKGNRLFLKANDIQFDDRGGAIVRPRGVVPIPPEDVRKAYGKEMVLVLDPQKNRLESLDMTLGPLIGRHVFTKGGE